MSLDFSLIIPTRDRCQLLSACLHNLELQRYPRNRFEILVIDDGSQDETPQAIRHSAERLPVVAIRQTGAGAGAARNAGVLRARGIFCLFIDDDVLASPDLLANHRESHAEHLNRLVRGPVINFSISPPLKPHHDLWRYYSMNYLCTSNASLRRDWLLEAGLFDPDFQRWEDAELGVRLKRLGVRRFFNSKAYVDHWKPQQSLAERQRIATLDGKSAAQLIRRYPGWRMVLRSGLHPLNEVKNRLLRRIDALPIKLKEELAVEASYLEAGR
jgi:glycosyltransferase involved in cell wall biosynthesis